MLDNRITDTSTIKKYINFGKIYMKIPGEAG
jgi:hypothetical protein